MAKKGCRRKLFIPSIAATAGYIIKITFKQLLPFPFKGINYKQSCLSRISDGTVFQIYIKGDCKMIKVIEKDDSRMGQYIDQFNDVLSTLDMMIQNSSDLDLINSMVRAREFMTQTVRRLEQSEISMPFV